MKRLNIPFDAKLAFWNPDTSSRYTLIPFKLQVELLRNLRERKLSIEETGLQILKKNLEDLKFSSTFDSESVFKLLSDGKTERAFDILTGQQKTLTQFRDD